MKSSKQQVITKYPGATIGQIGNKYEIYESVFWDFFGEPWCGDVIGIGGTQKEAWKDAIKGKVKKSLIEERMSQQYGGFDYEERL